MNIDFKKVGKFLSENRGYIFYGLSAIFTAVVGAKYGINVGTMGNTTNVDFTKPVQTIDLALNSKQAAVSSLRNTALNTTWSSDKKGRNQKDLRYHQRDQGRERPCLCDSFDSGHSEQHYMV